MQLLQIIRWKNLMMIALVQGLIKYYLMPLFTTTAILSNWQFILLILASVFIAAGGYIINDIYDLETDILNKPKKVWIPTFMKIENARIFYYSITLLGLFLGVFVSITSKIYFGVILFLAPTLLLFFYAVWGKKMLIVSNLIVSLLISFSLLIVLFFETNILTESDFYLISLRDTIYGLALFAFIINFVREVIKDTEDLEGDRKTGVISIPIKFGIGITKLIVTILIGIICGIIALISIINYPQQPYLVVYLVLAVFISLVLFINQLQKAKKPSDYGKLSSFLKIIMIIGMLTVFMIKPL